MAGSHILADNNMTWVREIGAGLSWTSAAYMSRHTLRLATRIILARLLVPEDFGLLALIAIATTLMETIREAGLGPALIQREALEERHLSTAFWTSVGLGVAMALILVAAAPGLAKVFSEPRLTPLARTMSLTFVISGLGSVHGAHLTRRMKFKSLAAREVASIVLSGGIAIALALTGAGVWSLVAKSLSGAAFSSIFLWFSSGWKPAFVFEWRALKDLVSFSAYVTAFALLRFFTNHIDNILVGVFLGAGALGIYSLAFGTVTGSTRAVSSIFGRVVFPTFSRLQGAPQKVRSAYLGMVEAIAVIFFLPLTGLAVLAVDFTPWLYGRQWVDAGPLVAVFAVMALGAVIGTNNGSLYRSQGRPGLQVRMMLLLSPVLWIGMAIGLQWGLMGVALGRMVAGYVILYPGFRVPLSLVGLRVRDLFGRLAGPLAAAAATAASLVGLRWLLVDQDTWLLISAGAIVGTVVYVATLLLVGRRTLRRMKRIVGLLFDKSQQGDSPGGAK